MDADFLNKNEDPISMILHKSIADGCILMLLNISNIGWETWEWKYRVAQKSKPLYAESPVNRIKACIPMRFDLLAK